MCGICGIVCSGSDSHGEINAMTSIIKHRGPDGEGYFILDTELKSHCAGGSDTLENVWSSKLPYSPNYHITKLQEKPYKLAFGHRRLSILDLSPAGHQPMSYANGRYWLIFNGEIYNYQDIKAELNKLGHIFVTKTDTEVVLASYAEWGTECLNRFAGMWALAIYDSLSNELFLSRDRFGIKPFYYWFSPSANFCFASEIKQFTVLNGWQAKLNPQRAHDQLIYSFADHTDETLFSKVFQLPSGSFFKARLDKIVPDATGRINYNKWYLLKRKAFKGEFTEASTIFKSLFEISVREHLNADVPVGSALSGGLDSSSIVCEINRILRTNGKTELQKTFSSCSHYEKFDERKWMDIVVDYTRVDAHFAYPGLEEASKLTSEIIWYQDEPYQSQSILLAYNIFRLAQQNNVKVILNGQGADEYLGGYGQFSTVRYANMLRQFKLCSFKGEVYSNRINPFIHLALAKGTILSLLPLFLRKSITYLNNKEKNIKRIIDLDKLQAKNIHPLYKIPTKDRTVPEITEQLTFYSTLPKYLHWEDRNSMANSVEARVPFLDHRLFEFAYNLHEDFLEKDGITKRIMREAMNDLVPEIIINRRDKVGYVAPEEFWVKKENPGLFRQKISEAIDVTNKIIKPEALIYFDSMVNGKTPFDYTYLRLILFSEWIKKFQIKI